MSRRGVVLTGASRGLGLAMARGLAKQGLRIFGCGRSEPALEALRREFSGDHDFRVVEVSDPAAVEGWAREVEERAGAADLVINNAALINRNAPLWRVPAEEFSTLVDVNIKGVANVIRAFLPAMIDRGTGVVVNFSSGWGRSTSPEVAPYCASKWAIEGLTSALAQELPAGLAAVALNPGVIRTEMLESCMGAAAAAYPDPESWARRAVPYLLSLGPKDNGKPATVPS
ncbi:MAG: SDR family NAD(P)-dependent oxidoreductase [Deltaproteobacteria bacterium]|nr:SDR family NAD(P)-dependent oxidoreductase [Deltaproteobacteria bacterium]